MPPPPLDAVPRGTETVLILSSEPDTRKLAVYMLEKQGYKVMEARDGPQALALCNEHGDPIELLLADVSLPRVNGYDLALKILEQKPGLKLLFMSYADGPTTRRVREYGAPMLHKPFTMRLLAGKVREVLDTPMVRAAG